MASNTHLVSGMVLDPKGRPVKAATVYFASGPGQFPDIAALTDDHGRFSLAAPSPGSYVIECSADGYAPTTVRLRVSEEKETTLEIRLGR
jgi:hypothetical protein